MTMKDATKNCPASTTIFPSSVSLVSGSSSTALSSSATSGTYIGSAASRTPGTTSLVPSPFISMATIPNSMPPILNSKALESVDSFHSAMSSQNEDGEFLKIWRNEMALSAVKHFNMDKKDAEEWAIRLPIPSNIPATIATAEPFNLAENSPRPQVEDKPQEPCRDKVEADLEELESLVKFQAGMGFAGLHMPDTSLSLAPITRKRGRPRIAKGMHELKNDEEDYPFDDFENLSATTKIIRPEVDVQLAFSSAPPDTSTSFDKFKPFGPTTPPVKWESNLSDNSKSTNSTKLARQPSDGPERNFARVNDLRQSNGRSPRSRRPTRCRSLSRKAERGQASQQIPTSVGQPYDQPLNLMGKPHNFMASAAGHTEEVSGQALEKPKKDPSTQPMSQFLDRQMAFFHHQNEASNQDLGVLWFRALANVKSFDHIISGNLQRLLAREDVFITSAAGSGPLVINPDWSANPRKERIATYCQKSPRAASSIQRILEILGVMEETIGLKIGAIAWASLLSVVEDLLSLDTRLAIDSQIEIIAELAEIASIIARYTVMENIYAQWKGMSLDKDYEQSLINLSTHVLIYIGALFSLPRDVGGNSYMKPYFQKIVEADTACRGFTVIISSEVSAIDQKRSIEDISDDSDDSDNIVLGDGGESGMQDMPLLAKRMRI
ncbi:hypothetical protein EAF04_004732 [Stromatinia cepivora]|nr:hypothetical protein EAF04_004732 [Stromatinia cepivora]